MCSSFVKCKLFLCRHSVRRRFRSPWIRLFVFFSVFLFGAIFDTRRFGSFTRVRDISTQKRSVHSGKSVPDAAEDRIYSYVQSKTRATLSPESNDFSEITFIQENCSRMEEATGSVSNSSHLDYENPPITIKLLYERGHDILPRNVCVENGKDLSLMIVITSSLDGCARRQAIRSTWASVAQRDDINVAFLVGQSTNDYENQLLRRESELYGDLIQGTFIDTYNNLTLKSISMLEWAISHCNQTQFLLKVDDDVLINPDMLFAILKRHKTKKQRKAIIGKVAKSWKLDRKKDSKYYVPRDQYKNVMYPNFNTGPAYMLTNDVIAPLYSAALEEVFFKLEDVFLTGLVARKLNIAHVNYRQFYNRRPDDLDKCIVKRLATVHGVNPSEMLTLWSEITNITLADCPKRENNNNYD